MKRVEITGMLAVALLAPLPMLAVAADLTTLEHNPFTRPKVLEVKPVSVRRDPPVPLEAIELELTATMVSETNPMVIVDGELLAPGDTIRGLTLIRVMEGKAVFARAGKTQTYTVEGEL